MWRKSKGDFYIPSTPPSKETLLAAHYSPFQIHLTLISSIVNIMKNFKDKHADRFKQDRYKLFNTLERNVYNTRVVSNVSQYTVDDKNNITQSHVIIVVKSKNSMKNYCIVSRYLLLGRAPHCPTSRARVDEHIANTQEIEEFLETGRLASFVSNVVVLLFCYPFIRA